MAASTNKASLKQRLFAQNMMTSNSYVGSTSGQFHKKKIDHYTCMS